MPLKELQSKWREPSPYPIAEEATVTMLACADELEPFIAQEAKYRKLVEAVKALEDADGWYEGEALQEASHALFKALAALSVSGGEEKP